MPKEIRLTLYGLRVLKIFSGQPEKGFSGSEIALKTNLIPGTLYPLLTRFEETGLFKSHWEKADPGDLKRPRKRFYTITKLGIQRYKFEASRNKFTP